MRIKIAVFTLCLMTVALCAQPPQARPQRGGGDNPPPPAQGPRPAGLRMGPPGPWWNDAELAKKLNISADQQKKMGDIFQGNRTKMIDLTATLQKEEVTLEPLIKADVPEDTKILAQIDKVAAARAELEKNHAKMLLAMRHVLTPEQWKQLASEDREGRGGPRGGGPNGGGPRGDGPARQGSAFQPQQGPPQGGGPGGPPPPARRPNDDEL